MSICFHNFWITLLLSLPKVILPLHAKPYLRAITNQLAKTPRHSRCDGRAAVDHALQRNARYAQLFCRFVHAQLQFRQNVIANDEAGMSRVVHSHDQLSKI